MVIFISKFIDLTGQKFNHLTVLKRGDDLIKKNGKKQPRWICQCDCGNPNTVLVLGYNLKNGNTKSCGCEHLLNGHKQGSIYGRINGINNKKYNKYDLSGNYGIGYTLKNEPFYFDKEDFDLIKDYCWYISPQGYVINQTEDHTVYMHRLVMHCPDDKIIDHIFYLNGKPTRNDNRKKNLRIVSVQLNRLNHTIASNNTSGYTGVSFYSKLKKWVAEIWINKKKIHLGTFDNIEEAIQAREEGEIKYFGEYRFQNKEVI